MIENKDVFVVHENDLDSNKDLFNLFWKMNNNISYVVDDINRLVGVITNRSLLKQIEKNGQEIPSINKECSVIEYGKDRYLFEKAKKIFEKNNIRIAIPVLNEKGCICFEIRKKEMDEEKIIAGFRGKFSRYEKSSYLGKEVECLRRLLEEQNIVVIGTKERFNYIFGDLILRKDRITFLDGLENAYEFMCENEKLFVDLSPVGFRGRFDIYSYCNNGYHWKQFVQLIQNVIELELCSRFYRVLDNELVTLRSFLNRYMDSKSYFSNNGLFTHDILKYLKKYKFNVEYSRGVKRGESFQFDLKLNGIKVGKNRNDDEFTPIICTDIILQLAILSKNLKKRVPVLNFCFDEIVEMTDTEQDRIEKEDGNLYFSERLQDFAELYSLGENSKEYLVELNNSIHFEVTRTFENNLILLKDKSSRLVNVENGIRRTCYQPKSYDGTIYCLGACTMWGWLVEDRYTIPSLIQKYVNDTGSKYRVINLGCGDYIHADHLIESLDIKEKDIFIILFPFLTDKIRKDISIIEIGKHFNNFRKNKYAGVNCFFNMVQHCGTNGNIIYSEIIYDKLKNYLPKIEQTKNITDSIYHVFRRDIKDLNNLYGYGSYLEEMRNATRQARVDKNKQIGCIVMNCNPFTLGHRYLIEYAMDRVDYLYIFVLEEDKSYFSFADRYEMVKRGTDDLCNVIILRSSNMIISSITFPAYFTKGEKLPEKREFNVSIDLKIFAQYIAPAVNIKIRFVGEEPTDPITAIYNKKMKEILPEFGIQIVEIPRKYMDGEAISASTVRKYYKEDNFDKIRRLVPDTTLRYLMDMN